MSKQGKLNEMFDKTMKWLLLVFVIVATLAGISKCAHGNDRPREIERELTTLTDSIHEFEDGF